MKKVLMLTLAVLVSGAMNVVPAAAAPSHRFDPVTQKSRELVFKNTRAGFKVFRQVCKKCHHRGNDKGAKFLYTESMGMKGWNRVFYEKYPLCARTGEWNKLSKEQLLQLHDYLFSYARDANNPFCSV